MDSAHWITWPHGGDTHYWYYKMEFPLLSSVKTIDAGHNLQLYPNPSSAKIFFDIQDLFHLQKIEITDVAGRLLNSQHSSSAITSIDISQLQPGIYYLHAVFLDRREETISFVKTN